MKVCFALYRTDQRLRSPFSPVLLTAVHQLATCMLWKYQNALAYECNEHYPYTQCAAVTSHSSLTREAPQTGLKLKWSETIQGQASLLASFPPAILVPLF